MVKDNAFLIDRFTWREPVRVCSQAIYGMLCSFILSLPEIGNQPSIICGLYFIPLEGARIAEVLDPKGFRKGMNSQDTNR
jgi:hypothetical protein